MGPTGIKPGVFFFSLDAANLVAVAIARRFFHLLYYRAAIRLDEDARAIRYASLRTHPQAAPARLEGARRAPTGGIELLAGARSITGWPNATASTQPTHAPALPPAIHHAPWLLQAAGAEIVENTVAAPAA